MEGASSISASGMQLTETGQDHGGPSRAPTERPAQRRSSGPQRARRVTGQEDQLQSDKTTCAERIRMTSRFSPSSCPRACSGGRCRRTLARYPTTEHCRFRSCLGGSRHKPTGGRKARWWLQQSHVQPPRGGLFDYLQGAPAAIRFSHRDTERCWPSAELDACYASAPAPIATVPSERTGEMRPKTLPSGSSR